MEQATYHQVPGDMSFDNAPTDSEHDYCLQVVFDQPFAQLPDALSDAPADSDEWSKAYEAMAASPEYEAAQQAYQAAALTTLIQKYGLRMPRAIEWDWRDERTVRIQMNRLPQSRHSKTNEELAPTGKRREAIEALIRSADAYGVIHTADRS